MKKKKLKIECDFYETKNPHGFCRIDGETCHISDHDATKCEKVVVVDFLIVDNV